MIAAFAVWMTAVSAAARETCLACAFAVNFTTMTSHVPRSGIRVCARDCEQKFSLFYFPSWVLEFR
jgi:hypothetical protein